MTYNEGNNTFSTIENPSLIEVHPGDVPHSTTDQYWYTVEALYLNETGATLSFVCFNSDHKGGDPRAYCTLITWYNNEIVQKDMEFQLSDVEDWTYGISISFIDHSSIVDNIGVEFSSCPDSSVFFLSIFF